MRENKLFLTFSEINIALVLTSHTHPYENLEENSYRQKINDTHWFSQDSLSLSHSGSIFINKNKLQSKMDFIVKWIHQYDWIEEKKWKSQKIKEWIKWIIQYNYKLLTLKNHTFTNKTECKLIKTIKTIYVFYFIYDKRHYQLRTRFLHCF